SLTDALSEARNEEERRKASHGLDAFHQTFNFCMSCRQYTCAACWNAEAGRCLSCEPIEGADDPVQRIAALGPVAAMPVGLVPSVLPVASVEPGQQLTADETPAAESVWG